MSKDQTCNKNP